MIAKEQTDNQANEVLTSIPQAIKNEVKKCAKERKAMLFEAMSFSKKIIEKQNALVGLAYQVLIDPKKLDTSGYKTVKEWFPLKTIDCLPLNTKEVHEEIANILRLQGFGILYIKGLKSGDDDILTDICKLKRKTEKRKWQEQSIVNLTEDEITKIKNGIKNGKRLYYDRNKHKIASKAEGNLIEIRETPGEDETVYYKYLSRGLIIISSLEKLPDWVEYEFEIISLDGEEAVVAPVVGTVESKEQQGEDIGQYHEDASPHLHGNIFRYKGGRWEMAFKGETKYPVDQEGYNYISYVLANPRNQIHNYTLYAKVKGLKPGLVTVGQQFDSNLYPGSPTKPKTTEQDRSRDYEKNQAMFDSLEECNKELNVERAGLVANNSNPPRVEEIDAQLIVNTGIIKSIAKDFESGGKQGITTATTVNTVYMAIYRGLNKIKEEHPNLRAHLKACFYNGKDFTSYTPDPDNPPRWQTDWQADFP